MAVFVWFQLKVTMVWRVNLLIVVVFNACIISPEWTSEHVLHEGFHLLENARNVWKSGEICCTFNWFSLCLLKENISYCANSKKKNQKNEEKILRIEYLKKTNLQEKKCEQNENKRILNKQIIINIITIFICAFVMHFQIFAASIFWIIGTSRCFFRTSEVITAMD